MKRIFFKIFSITLFLIFLPVIIVFSLPKVLIKKYKRHKYSHLFTLIEKKLIFKAQNLLKMNRAGIVSYDSDLLKVAESIEKARIICQSEEDLSYISSSCEFSLFLLYNLSIDEQKLDDWKKINDFYALNEVFNIEGEINKEVLLQTYFSRALNN